MKSAALPWLVPAGVATEPADRAGLTTRGQSCSCAAGDLSSRQHADALDRLGIARSAAGGLQHLRIDATMLGTRVNEALPLIVDMVRRPRMDEDAIEPAATWLCRRWMP